MHGLVSIDLTHWRRGGPVMEQLQADPERMFAAAIERLVDSLRA